MQTHPNRCQLLNRTILNLINTIEDESGLMFHEFDSKLDDKAAEVMDSKNPALLNALIIELEEIVSKGEYRAKA